MIVFKRGSNVGMKCENLGCVLRGGLAWFDSWLMVDIKFGRYSKQCFQPKELFSIFKRKNKICCWSNNKRLFVIRLVTGQKISLRDLPHILHVFFFHSFGSIQSDVVSAPVLVPDLVAKPGKVLGC